MSFHKVSWGVQLLVGIGLFSLSFLIQSQVMVEFIQGFWLAVGIAAALELGKAMSIIWHRFMTMNKEIHYPFLTLAASATFRVGLIALSLWCSILFISDALNAPNSESVRAADMALAEQQMQERLGAFKEGQNLELSALQNSQQEQMAVLKQRYQGQIDALQGLITKEMDNSVNGQFIGPRYKELQRRLETTTSEYDAALNRLQDKQSVELSSLRQEQSASREVVQAEALKALTEKQTTIQETDYNDDERAGHPMVLAFVKVMNDVIGWQMSNSNFVLAFAVLISLLIEIGILIAFENVTVLYPTIFAAKKRSYANDDDDDWTPQIEANPAPESNPAFSGLDFSERQQNV